jgi:hypothetical protein
MKPEEQKLFEKFKASHKELTRYEDVLASDGNLENVLADYSLGELKAIHVYDSGVYMEEGWPEEERDGPCEPFCCTIGNESRTAQTREELEPMLFEWWRWECYEAPKGSYEDMVKRPEKYGREDLLKLLQANDPNGEYTDKVRDGETGEYVDRFDSEYGPDPVTWEEAVNLVIEMLQDEEAAK